MNLASMLASKEPLRSIWSAKYNWGLGGNVHAAGQFRASRIYARVRPLACFEWPISVLLGSKMDHGSAEKTGAKEDRWP